MLYKMLEWFRRAKNQKTNSVAKENIPSHIAIIMDGNGRWAKKRGLPRVAGHREGMKTVKEITHAAHDLGVSILTLYAFSTENWKRREKQLITRG
jgi:undecaprenyl diphosphate synthase